MKATILVTSTLVLAAAFARAETAPVIAPSDLSADRYQIRKTPPEKAAVAPTVKVPTKKKSRVPSQETSEAKPALVESPSDTKVKSLEKATAMEEAVPNPPAVPISSEPQSFKSRLQDIVLGGEPEKLADYRSYLLPDDQRRNLVEILFAPAYIYNDSSSNYWFRNYNAAAPAGLLGATMWFTPFFGLQTQYEITFGESITNSHNLGTTTPTTDNWFSIGLRFRRFLEGGDRPASFTWGLDYATFEKKVPSDERMRPGLTTKGPRLIFESQMPTSRRYSWTFGLDVAPFQKHEETSTSLTLSSGNKVESYGFGAWVGGQIQVVRTNRLYWKARYYNEKDIFTGNASQPDPITTQTPSGVTVSNSFTSFELGYIWGY